VLSQKKAVAEAIRAAMSEAEITVTTHPLKLDTETIQQRAQIIAANYGAHVHHITAHCVDDRLSLSFDLEVDGKLPLSEAHRIATELEADMLAEFGPATEVETHIEPLQDATLAGRDADVATLADVAAALTRLAAEDGILSDVHNVRARQTAHGLIVIFHCRTAPERTVAEIHGTVDDLERRLRASVPGIWRTVAHAEPTE
jgi:divalent metal cation (Fe/Co/Zn/Cd) transporter